MTEPNERSSNAWTWVVILALCAVLLAWGLLNYVLIRDEPRRFDLNTLPDVPGQSIYSSEPAPKQPVVPSQVAPLPEAVPKSPAGGQKSPAAPPKSPGALTPERRKP